MPGRVPRETLAARITLTVIHAQIRPSTCIRTSKLLLPPRWGARRHPRSFMALSPRGVADRKAAGLSEPRAPCGQSTVHANSADSAG